MNRIDLWTKALEGAFNKTGEIAPWPVHIGAVAPYFSDVEARDIFDKLRKLSKEKDAHSIVRKLLISPSVAKALLMDFIIGMKAVRPRITAKERVWFVNYLFDVLEEMQRGDIFCLNGKNVILSGREAQDLFKDTPWTWLKEGRRELGSSIYRVSASAKSLIWSLYFYGWDDVGYEIHGPYTIRSREGKKFKLLVFDYFDLKPDLLWDSIKDFPYRSIKLLALFKEDAELEVDIFCHFISKGSLLDSTEAIYLEVDKVPIRKKSIAHSISRRLLDKVSEQHVLIRKMNKKEVIKKYVESRYYAFRRWRQFFGEDWYPPNKVLKRISQWDVIKIPEGESSWEELKRAFDPRTNYIPGT